MQGLGHHQVRIDNASAINIPPHANYCAAQHPIRQANLITEFIAKRAVNRRVALFAMLVAAALLALKLYAPADPTALQRLMASLLLCLCALPTLMWVSDRDWGHSLMPITGVAYGLLLRLIGLPAAGILRTMAREPADRRYPHRMDAAIGLGPAGPCCSPGTSGRTADGWPTSSPGSRSSP